MKDGLQLTVTEKISITTDDGSKTHRVKITKTESIDEGVYSLVATNEEGETKNDVKLTVRCNYLSLKI